MGLPQRQEITFCTKGRRQFAVQLERSSEVDRGPEAQGEQREELIYMYHCDIGKGISLKGGDTYDKEKSNAGVPRRGRSRALEDPSVRGEGIGRAADTAGNRSIPEGLAEKGGAPMRERGSGSIFKKPG